MEAFGFPIAHSSMIGYDFSFLPGMHALPEISALMEWDGGMSKKRSLVEYTSGHHEPWYHWLKSSSAPI